MFQSMMSHGQLTLNQGSFFTRPSIWFIIGAVILFILLIKIIGGFIFILHQHHHTKERDKIANYKAAGLSEADIKLFRATLQEAKEEIEKWEQATKADPDVSVIEDVTSGLASSKKLFKAIVDDPKELTKQNDFLYQQLPNMVKLLETFDALKKEPVSADRDSAETLLLIKTLSAAITKRYHQLLMKDVAVIGKEIANADH